MTRRDDPCKPLNHRLPFVVGFTGKCELGGAGEALGDQVVAYFREFHDRYPHTPILLLSSLAVGADQVVAERVVRLRDDKNVEPYVSLVAVLPMHDPLYKAVFVEMDDKEPLAKYTKLKESACRTITMPSLSDEADLARPGKGNPSRELQYLLAGTFIARRCHILIAAWDGEPAQGIGGTSSVLEFRQSGRLTLPDDLRRRFHKAPAPFGLPPHPIEVPETGPVQVFLLKGEKAIRLPEEMPRPAASAWIEAGRTESDRSERGVEKHREAYIERFDRIHKENLEDFNALAESFYRDSARAREQDKRKARAGKPDQYQKRAESRDGEGRRQLPGAGSPGLSDSIRRLADIYATADGLADHHQKKVNRLIVRGILPIFLAVIAFAAYAHLAEEPWKIAFLVAFFVLLATSYVIYIGSHPRSLDLLTRLGKSRRTPHHDDKNRYQDFRTISEGLRVQLFWRLAGMPDFVSDYYLTRQKNEIDWIRAAIGAWGLLSKPAGEAEPESGDEPESEAEPTDDQIAHVRTKWVVSQLAYYIRSSYRDRIGHLFFHQMAAGLIVAGILTGVWLAGHHLRHDHGWTKWAIFGMPIPLRTVLVLALMALIVFAATKWIETRAEVEEDEEEFGQNATILGALVETWGEQDLQPIPKAFLKRRYRPLRWFLRLWEKGEGRPRIASVAKASLACGLGLGVLITLSLCGFSHILEIPSVKPVLGVYFRPHEPDWLIVAIAINAAVAALLQWYSEKQALGEQYRQYKRTKMTFLLAHEALETKAGGAPRPKAARIFKDLGRESLAEHADWLLLHRERPIELAWIPG